MRVPILVACLGLLATPSLHARAPTADLHGIVTHVSDGDTLWVRLAPDQPPQKLRLRGIDAPESCQAWGAEAAAALSTRVLGRQVRVRGQMHDEHGRLLARLWLGREDIERWMVSEGHAWSYRWQGRRGPYDAEQTRARERGVGLWTGAAVEPREFRRQHGPCAR